MKKNYQLFLLVIYFLSCFQIIQAQERVITGTVSDKTGETLPGATVLIKGTSNGTTTDFDGNYSIKVSSKESILVFSFIGYATKEVVLGNKSVINVILKEDSQALEEIVIVGYGSQKKENLTGAVNQIKADVLKQRPIVNLSEGLQGVVPNFNITSRNGAPGSSSNFNIRGVASISGNSAPLILVDGVEMNPDLINESDVESITVLKDAAASAIYGSRAAFGVVLIKTKNGEKSEKTTINFTSNTSIRTPTVLPDVVKSGYEQAILVNQAMENAGFGKFARYGEDFINRVKAYENDPANNPSWAIVGGAPGKGGRFQNYALTDWSDKLINKNAFTQKYTLSASGGNKVTSFYASIGYLDQEGLYKNANDSYQRLNTSLKLTNQTFSWLQTGFKVAFNKTINDTPHTYKSDKDVFNSLVFSSPFTPIQYPNDGSEFAGRYFSSPVANQKFSGRDKFTRNHILLNIDLQATINNHMRAVTNFTTNMYRNNSSQYEKKIKFLDYDLNDDYGHTANDYLRLSNTKRNYFVFNAYTEYERTFGKLYTKNMIGYNQEFTDSEMFSAKANGLINPEQPAINLSSGAPQIDGDQYELALRGGFFRSNFVYDEKYLLEINGRYDGTSRFSKKDRFVFSPSVSVGWRISKENFMESLNPVLNDLKFRASYGSLANQSFSSSIGGNRFYPYIPSLPQGNSSRIIFNDNREPYITAPRIVPESLTWETSSTLNFGVDAGFFNNKLTATFDIYTRKTKNMLLPFGNITDVVGASAPLVNGADLETKGWELSLNWKKRVNDEFKYSLGVNLADSRAVITKYDNPNGAIYNRGLGAAPLGQRYYKGYVLGQIWGYETVGIFQSDADVANAPDQSFINSSRPWKAGDIQYADLNGDNKIDKGDSTLENPGDLKVIGNATPRYTYGITGDISYSNFFLNVFFQGVGKRDYWPSNYGFFPYQSQFFQVQKHFVTDSWSETNRDAYFSRPYARNSKNRQIQSRFIQDASYIRLKNLTIGYNLPNSFLENLNVTQLKLFLSGQNLWEHSNMRKPLDPEINQGRNSLGQNTPNLGYTYQRTYSLGLNITF